ncbi:MAG: SpaH/EbpB family LPXTG-anchored major pilin [Lachnospiraceae bacterium]|nr:SpaH/EbpB family LPXTG-anchored major pilin [Lachnospiraceae bacterium]
MTKKMKKLLSLMLAVVMVLAMGVTAFAADNHKITITGAFEKDTYEAYQIFAGSESEGSLGNVTWGTGVKGDELLTELQKEDAYKDAKSAADVAKILGTMKTDSADLQAFAKTAAGFLTETTSGTYADGVISGLSDGYYLVQNATVDEQSSATRYILTVVKDAEVKLKADVPDSNKKVKDTNDSEANSTTDWQDSADYDIGDEIEYKLTANLPNNVSSYDTYKLSFVDTMSAGLTYVTGSAKIFVDGEEIAAFEPTSTATYSGNEEAYTGGTVLTWSIADVKVAPYNAGDDAVITIEYKARLNDNAKLGDAGNPNKMHIEFSNNPNNGGEGTGKTPDDTNIVFTYKTVVNKVDSANKPLTGADFKLEKYDAATETWKEIDSSKKSVTSAEDGTEGAVFTFSGLDDGTYRITETVTPAGYNTIEPIEFKIVASHVEVADNPTLTSLSGIVTSGVAEFTATADKSTLSTDVVNNKGSELPSTGGMGTTLFYIIGAILVLGAGVVLITRRRMSR